MKNYQPIPLTLFTTGASILALEIVASRLMAPTFGSSVFIWGAILSVTMLCLALGYAWGGRLADRPELAPRRLVIHILYSAFWIALVPVFNGWIMRASLLTGYYFGPIVASLIILGPPLTMLSTAVPLGFGVRQQQMTENPGRSIGNLFAISTAGSIAGALLAAYLLIPFLGVRYSLIAITLALILILLPSLYKNRYLQTACLLLTVLCGVRLLPPEVRGVAQYEYGVERLFQTDSKYGVVTVLEDHRDRSRILLLNGTSQNWVHGRDLLQTRFGYVDMTLRYARSIDGEDKSALVLGLGAGTVVRLLEKEGFQVFAAEIDQTIADVAREWFLYPGQRGILKVADGRTFLSQLNQQGRTFDLILFDVSGGGYQPPHLYNRDAFAEARELLKPGGILTANVVAFSNPAEGSVHRFKNSLDSLFRNVDAINLHPRIDPREVGTFFFAASDRLRWSRRQNVAPYERFLSDPQYGMTTDFRNKNQFETIKANVAFHKNIKSWLGEAASIPY